MAYSPTGSSTSIRTVAPCKALWVDLVHPSRPWSDMAHAWKSAAPFWLGVTRAKHHSSAFTRTSGTSFLEFHAPIAVTCVSASTMDLHVPGSQPVSPPSSSDEMVVTRGGITLRATSSASSRRALPMFCQNSLASDLGSPFAASNAADSSGLHLAFLDRLVTACCAGIKRSGAGLAVAFLLVPKLFFDAGTDVLPALGFSSHSRKRWQSNSLPIAPFLPMPKLSLERSMSTRSMTAFNSCTESLHILSFIFFRSSSSSDS
mmetsp:Transcript_33168/g.80227  ORF Transcript_33168/g.80227 Transcript_33168/m.80227 type:complete len:260 (-) Transcript_33168:734-1513(-)